MTQAVDKASRPATQPRRYDKYAAQIRLLVVLVLCFAVAPAALLITVGVLVLVATVGVVLLSRREPR